MTDYDLQYAGLFLKVLFDGVDIPNERTGKVCRTLPPTVLHYPAGDGSEVISEWLHTNVRGAVAEVYGYILGLDNAEDFDKIGTKTWYANANKTKAWLANPHRKGENDLGLVYGAPLRKLPVEGESTIDEIARVFRDIAAKKDERGLILNFWRPEVFGRAALRPCMYNHNFSIVGDRIHLTSTQRSCDVGLGLRYNSIQTKVLLGLASSVGGLIDGDIHHVISHPHLYDDQIEYYGNQDVDLSQQPHTDSKVKFQINRGLDVEKLLAGEYTVDELYTLTDYEPLNKLTFPFSE